MARTKASERISSSSAARLSSALRAFGPSNDQAGNADAAESAAMIGERCISRR
jgi:hypothetical protein